MWLIRRFESLLDNWLFYGSLIVLGATGFAIWASIKNLPGPVIALVTLGAVWFLLEICTTGSDLLKRLRRPRTPEQWAKTVREWLDMGGMNVQTVPNPEGAFFHFNAGYQPGKTIAVRMPTDRTPQCIMFMIGVRLTENSIRRFSELSANAQRKISYAYQLELVRFGVEVPLASPTKTGMQLAVQCEGLDEFRFQQHFVFMMRAGELGVLAWLKNFADAGIGPPESDTADSQPQPVP